MDKGGNFYSAVAGFTLTFYTDPLCCWCWVMESHLRELVTRYRVKVKWRYCMGGLIPDWNTYSDSRYEINHPSQMAAHWMYASGLTGKQINTAVWVNDPPASSYPACLAVKCAGLQSLSAEENFLRLMQSAVMENGWNISKKNVQMRLAKSLTLKDPKNFSIDRFADDLDAEEGRDAFRKDLREMQLSGIKQLPSVILHKKDAEDVLISGYRSPRQLEDLFSDFIGLAPLKKEESRK